MSKVTCLGSGVTDSVPFPKKTEFRKKRVFLLLKVFPGIMLNERRQIQQATYCMIPFVGNAQNRQIHGDRKKTGGWLLGAGVEGVGSDC